MTAEERVVRPEFTGSAAEYFRIWIVNLFFTMITLGIYSPWAKVRKKRYFYGSTRLDGDTFDYFGSPKQILKGRIVAFVIFVTYAFCAELLPGSQYAFWAIGFLVFPWLVVRALGFNARNSAWRGLRFGFEATAKQAAGIYMLRFLAVILTAGIAWPWFVARQKEFVVSHHAFGMTQLRCELSVRAFFGIYFRGGLIVLAVVVPLGAAFFFTMSKMRLGGELFWLPITLFTVGIYASYAVAYAYVQARTTNLIWNGTTGAGVRFSSSLGAMKLAKIYVGNIVAAAASLGLLIPWGAVRALRYRLECFQMIVEEELTREANPALAQVGATGQELGDFFNMDIGV
jgi:uncharacterized membrane protein YjgN (DUF898 family)